MHRGGDVISMLQFLVVVPVMLLPTRCSFRESIVYMSVILVCVFRGVKEWAVGLIFFLLGGLGGVDGLVLCLLGRKPLSVFLVEIGIQSLGNS